MNRTIRLLTSIDCTTDFAMMLQLMLKLNGTVITIQDANDKQCLYIVNDYDTIMYVFYDYNLSCTSVEPYSLKSTYSTHSVNDLIVKLSAQPHLTIIIHT